MTQTWASAQRNNRGPSHNLKILQTEQILEIICILSSK